MVDGISPFKGLKNKIFELDIKGEKIKVKPIVSDIEAFLLMKKDVDESGIKQITKIVSDIIERANPEEDKEDIASFVAMNYGEILPKLAVLFGFATEKQIEDAKKKITEG